MAVLDHVGVIALPGRQVEILPKVVDAPADKLPSDLHGKRRQMSRNLVWMVTRSSGMAADSGALAHLGEAEDTVLDGMARIYTARLLLYLTRSMRLSYATIRESSPSVRGKMLVRESLARGDLLRGIVHVELDERSIDTPLHRVMKRACVVLLRWVRSEELRQRTRACLRLLTPVSSRGSPRVDMRRVDRSLSKRSSIYDIFTMACMFIRGSAVTPETGAEDCVSFLYYMPGLFEAYIRTVIATYIDQFRCSLTQEPLYVGKRSSPVLRRRSLGEISVVKPGFNPKSVADVVLKRRRDDKVASIIDTKWKRSPDLKSSDAGDLCQIITYLATWSSPLGVLLYPTQHASAKDDLKLRSKALRHSTIRFARINFNRHLHGEGEEMRLAKELSHLVAGRTEK